MCDGRQQNRNHDYQLLADFCTTSQLPRPCFNLLQNISVDSDAADILTALILYIFHECGFVTFDLHTDDLAAIIPTYWGYTNVTQIPEIYSIGAALCIRRQQEQPSSDQSFTIYLKLLNFSEERLVLIMRKIVNGDAVCISFCFRDRIESICVPITQFIQIDRKTTAVEQIQRSPSKCLKNIEILTNKIKSQVITPIRNAIMSSAGLQFPSLIGLPKEILWHLMKRLDLKSLQNLSHTCTYTRNEVRIYMTENNINVTTRRRSTPIIRNFSNLLYSRF